MIEVHGINGKTGEEVRLLIAVDTIARVAERPEDKATIIVLKERQGIFSRNMDWLEVRESFAEVGWKIDEARKKLSRMGV